MLEERIYFDWLNLLKHNWFYFVVRYQCVLSRWIGKCFWIYFQKDAVLYVVFVGKLKIS